MRPQVSKSDTVCLINVASRPNAKTAQDRGGCLKEISTQNVFVERRSKIILERGIFFLLKKPKYYVGLQSLPYSLML